MDEVAIKPLMATVTPDYYDPEMEALAGCLRILLDQEPAARRRILDYLRCRLHPQA